MVGEGQTRRQEELLDKISCPPSPEVLQAGPGRNTSGGHAPGHMWGAPHTLHTRASSYWRSLMVLFFDSRTS